MPSKSALLLDIILRIPGCKIVTIMLQNNPYPQIFDIDESGKIGYALQHKQYLRQAFGLGIQTQAGVMIRQFIPDSYEETTLPNGTVGLLPWKALYAACLGQGRFKMLSAEEVEDAMCTDPVTGKFLPPEKMIIYKDLRDFAQH